MEDNMKNKIKCFFGLHDWKYPIPSERECKCCEKYQRYVIYPFVSPRKFWETIKKENGKAKIWGENL